MKILGELDRGLIGLVVFGPTYNLSALLGLLRVPLAPMWVWGVGIVWFRPDNSDVKAFRQVFIDGAYQMGRRRGQTKRIRAKYEAILAAGRTPLIIDAGANVGAATLYFASAFPAARVVAIEPDPGNCAVLRKNAGSRPNVTVVEGAVGAASGQVDLTPAGKKAWGVRTERSPTGAVRIYSTAELREIGGPDTDLLIYKIDIEGFERDLFSQATGWVDDAYALMVELHDWMLEGQGSSFAFQKAVMGKGFEMVLNGEDLILVRLD